MKKQLDFNIFVDGNRVAKAASVVSESLPENEHEFSTEELEKSGLKKRIDLKVEMDDDPESFGRSYTFRLSESEIKELFDFE